MEGLNHRVLVKTFNPNCPLLCVSTHINSCFYEQTNHQRTSVFKKSLKLFVDLKGTTENKYKLILCLFTVFLHSWLFQQLNQAAKVL